MTTNNNSITTLLDLIAEGNSSPKEFLQKIDPYQVGPEQPVSPPDTQCLTPGTTLQKLQDLRS